MKVNKKIIICCVVALFSGAIFLLLNITFREDLSKLNTPVGEIVLGDGTIIQTYPNPNKYKSADIETVLNTSAYVDLPDVVKDVIRKSYEENDEIILTQYNKEENQPYLNPRYVQYMSLSEEERARTEEIPNQMTVDYSARSVAASIDVPSSYDLRNIEGENFLTPVRNQGRLGICWAFATAGVAESHILKNNKSAYDESSSQLISERQIDYLTAKNGIKDYENEYVSFVDRFLGDGGNFYISTIALANGVSLIDYNDFKAYDDSDLSKMELEDVISYDKSLYEVNSTIDFPELNLRESTGSLTAIQKQNRDSFLKEVKQNIEANGAAYVGTYMDASCQYVDNNLNATVIDVYNCNITGGHAMEIIGWDDTLSYSYCADNSKHNSDTSESNCNKVVSGKGVWILKNSWGDTIQYPYLTYDSLYSQISFISEIQASGEKDWDNNYIFGSEDVNKNSSSISLADSKIRDEEKIKKVKFIVENSDTEYSVKIKKQDNTYETFSKRSDLPGLITIDITSDIIVDENTLIEVSGKNNSKFIDKIIVFTTNTNSSAIVDLSEYNDVVLDTNTRLYSETKNILSGTNIIYKLYDSNDQDVSDKLTVTNNKVAENNVNTLATFSDTLDTGTYKLVALYNSNSAGTANIKIKKMDGTGTINDPYIITTASHLYRIRDNLDAYYELGNDIDLSEVTSEDGIYSVLSDICPQGFGWEAISNFHGSLDGKGYTIKGLRQDNYITCQDKNMDDWATWSNSGNGLFASAYGNVTIKNLTLENFDINCQGGQCGALLSTYSNGFNDNPYTATFENIALKDSVISGVRNGGNNDSSKRNTYGGGLFGQLDSWYGNINISNIYLDFKLNHNKAGKNISSPAYLFSEVDGNNVNIKNILVKGDLEGKNNDGGGVSILGNISYSYGTTNIKNILSTVTANNIEGLFGTIKIKNGSVGNINTLSILPDTLCGQSENATFENTNIFEKDELYQLNKKTNYSTWDDFDDYWVMESVDGIPRLPVLKFVDFEYTSVDDMVINQNLNEYKNIYDYIKPNISSAKRINFRSNNEDIVKIKEDGTIIPQSTGSTTIHIESFYDGYIKDVPISVNYVPHYTIRFDANGGNGIMEDAEVGVGMTYVLPGNQFTKEYYEFKEWNTNADGSGTSYSNSSAVPAMNDKETLTLYAIWRGEEEIVTFNANGGYVNPDRKIVRIGEQYGELPIPTRNGYGFTGWSAGILYVDAFSELKSNGLDLVASWKDDSYTIIYDANNGVIKQEYEAFNNNYYHISDTAVTTYSKNNQDKTIIDNIYEKEGYIFKEWNTKPDGSGTSYAEEQDINLSNVENSTLRLYAIWNTKTYSVTFKANNGTENETVQTIQENVSTKLNKNTFTKENHIFVGWNTQADGSGDSYSDEQEITIFDNLILYAQWEEAKVTVVFKANGGTGNDSTQEITRNSPTKLNKNTFYRDNYIFSGWNTAANGRGTAYSDEQRVTLDKGLTLYAQWTRNDPITIKNYTRTTDGKYITKIPVGATLNEYYQNMIAGIGYSLVVETKTINNKKVLYTGGKTQLKKDQTIVDEYINVVSGEANGDGMINSADLLRVRQHLLSLNPLTGAYYLAANVTDGDNEVNSADLLRVRQHLLNIKLIK